LVPNVAFHPAKSLLLWTCAPSSIEMRSCEWSWRHMKHFKYYGPLQLQGHNNNEPSINIVTKFIQMDDKLFKIDEILFKPMKNCQIGWIYLLQFSIHNIWSICYSKMDTTFPDKQAQQDPLQSLCPSEWRPMNSCHSLYMHLRSSSFCNHNVSSFILVFIVCWHSFDNDGCIAIL
jgi:hypothetical protein